MDVVSKKMATSASRWCQASGELSAQLGDTFDNRSCREHMAAGMLSMSKGNIYSNAFDASRLGEPAVETNLYLLWSRSAGRSMWLAPQAIGVFGPTAALCPDCHQPSDQKKHQEALAQCVLLGPGFYEMPQAAPNWHPFSERWRGDSYPSAPSPEAAAPAFTIAPLGLGFATTHVPSFA